MRGTQTGKMWYYYILNFRTGFKGLQVFVALLIHLCPQITIMVKMAAWLRAPLSFVVTKGSDCPFTHIHTCTPYEMSQQCAARAETRSGVGMK